MPCTVIGNRHTITCVQYKRPIFLRAELSLLQRELRSGTSATRIEQVALNQLIHPAHPPHKPRILYGIRGFFVSVL